MVLHISMEGVGDLFFRWGGASFLSGGCAPWGGALALMGGGFQKKS